MRVVLYFICWMCLPQAVLSQTEVFAGGLSMLDGLQPGISFEEFERRAIQIGCLRVDRAGTLSRAECSICEAREDSGFCSLYNYNSGTVLLFGKPIKTLAYLQVNDGRSKVTVTPFAMDKEFIGRSLAGYHQTGYAGNDELMVWEWPGGRIWWGGETLHILRENSPSQP